jgi:hypothetical protein
MGADASFVRLTAVALETEAGAPCGACGLLHATDIGEAWSADRCCCEPCGSLFATRFAEEYPDIVGDARVLTRAMARGPTMSPYDPSGHRCFRCGRPADLLLYEPDGWLCQPCSDEMGRESVQYSLETFT